MEAGMSCEHFWRTVELLGHGFISECEKCEERHSSEHSDWCPALLGPDRDCTCGAEKEYVEFMRGSHETLR
jgi:hypothetical protein